MNEWARAQRFARQVRATLHKLPNPSVLVLGDYRSRECRHLAGLYPDTPVVLLDDGSATHQIARYRRNPKGPEIASLFPEPEELRSHRLRLFAGITLPFIERATFFTHYQIHSRLSDSVIRHAYTYWRNHKQALGPKTDEIWFLGMSHVEKNLTSLSGYLAALSFVRRYYAERTLYYRPHRDETGGKLAYVTTLGFTIIKDERPIELVLLADSRLPAEIATIASSAVDNCAVLFGEAISIRCFLPWPNYAAPSLRAHLSDIIAYHVRNSRANLHTVEMPQHTGS